MHQVSRKGERMQGDNSKECIEVICLLSSAVDRLFSELLKHENVHDMDPELLECVQNAAEYASEFFVDINLLGGGDDE